MANGESLKMAGVCECGTRIIHYFLPGDERLIGIGARCKCGARVSLISADES